MSAEFTFEIACKYANDTPELLSMLYDIDLMPEQATPGATRHRFMVIVAHWRHAFSEHSKSDIEKYLQEAARAEEALLRAYMAAGGTIEELPDVENPTLDYMVERITRALESPSKSGTLVSEVATLRLEAAKLANLLRRHKRQVEAVIAEAHKPNCGCPYGECLSGPKNDPGCHYPNGRGGTSCDVSSEEC